MTADRHRGDRLTTERLTLGYPRRPVIDALDVTIPDNSFTVIIGPNGCGKSTLLRGLARLLKPAAGHVLLDGGDIHRMPAKTFARAVGLLPQSPITPDALTVADLVSRGRNPHHGLITRWSPGDQVAVDAAMAATSIGDLAATPVAQLSGGQRQRVWIAMVLAQQTPILLLDEPTTYLDIAHQIEVLELCRRLHLEQDRTLVAVLHDVNQAARYADHLIVMAGGAVVAEGAPADVLTADLIGRVFGVACRVIEDPECGAPLMIPAFGPSAMAIEATAAAGSA